MIFDTTANAAKYKGLSPQLDYAMDLVGKIEESGFAFDVELPAGDGVRVVRLNYETSPYEKSVFEAHRKEIDVMVLIEGSETIGWKPVADLRTISREYSEEGDALLSEDKEGTMILPMKVGRFCVFFPQDAHMPGMDDGEKQSVKKIILKVRV